MGKKRGGGGNQEKQYRVNRLSKTAFKPFSILIYTIYLKYTKFNSRILKYSKSLLPYICAHFWLIRDQWCLKTQRTLGKEAAWEEKKDAMYDTAKRLLGL